MKKTIKLITLILSAVLLIGAAIGISVSATTDAPTVEIVGKNLSYEGAIKVLYAVEATNVPEGAKVQMAFFDKMPTSAEDTPKYVKDENSKTLIIGDKECKAFFSEGIAPKDMRKNIYAVPVITQDGEILVIGEPTSYSIYTYATNMFEKSPTEEQKALYTSLLDYGASVQRVLLDSNDYTAEELEAAGGYADEYCGIKLNTFVDGELKESKLVGYYGVGELIKIDAEKIYNGALFNGFTNADGTKVDAYDGAVLSTWHKNSVVAMTPGVVEYNHNYTTSIAYEDYEEASSSQNNYTISNGSTPTDFTIVDGGNGTGSALDINKAVGESGTLNYYMYAKGATKYVFDTDIKWFGSEATHTTDNYWGRMGFKSTASANSGTGVASNNYNYIYCTPVCTTKGEPTYIASGHDCTSATPGSIHAALQIGEWHNLRMEYVVTGSSTNDKGVVVYSGTEYFYLDGVLVDTQSHTTTYDNTDFYSFTIGLRAAKVDSHIQLDNTYVYADRDDYYGKGEHYEDSYKYGTDKNGWSGIIAARASQANFSNVLFDDNNYAFQIIKPDTGATASGNNVWFYVNENAATLTQGQSYVFETDFRYLGSPAPYDGSRWGAEFGFTSSKSSTTLHAPMYFYTDKSAITNSTEILYYDATSRTDEYAVINNEWSFVPGVWYNIRVIYTPTGIDDSGKYTGVQKVYINNELVYETQTASANDNTALVCYCMSLRRYASALKYQLDNTYAGVVTISE